MALDIKSQQMLFKSWHSITLALVAPSLTLLMSKAAHAAQFNCPNCDLRNINISSRTYLGANRQNSNLAGANLESANLTNNVFMGSNLKGAILRNAVLENTFFTGGANLEGADLRGARIIDTMFTSSNLRNADLRGVRIPRGSKIYLERADLRGAKVDPGFFDNAFLLRTILPNGRIVSGRMPPSNVGTIPKTSGGSGTFVNTKCRRVRNSAGSLRVDYQSVFKANNRSYRFYVARAADGAGLFCVSDKNYSDAFPLRLPAIQNRFYNNIKRKDDKPVYKFNIRYGNGRQVPVTRYKLQLRNPRKPELRVLKNWID
ncbi:MAG: hypothetical protein CL862_10310 [Cyanobium sp. NAT70]|nr:hypothetical protein [Cyanobium sp. NAT70]